MDNSWLDRENVKPLPRGRIEYTGAGGKAMSQSAIWFIAIIVTLVFVNVTTHYSIGEYKCLASEARVCGQ